MPSSTPKQANFMAACAHGAGYSSCPPAKVSKEFNQADKGTGIIGRHKVRSYWRGRGPEGKQHWSECDKACAELFP